MRIVIVFSLRPRMSSRASLDSFGKSLRMAGSGPYLPMDQLDPS